ncbi:MAG TPA: tRNA uridine-5-carboxymethylaminomethyl(34) synthesis GTPase MnmE [Candidatus Binataceae bacterium]|nr:tRNA uridine-5-carboxymethylaminomethyl(34) synthesis GTPase MnmE [Candidatus Binataceae bacterium]
MYIPDTIVAPATAPGSSAIAIIRLSGPAAITIARRLWHPLTSSSTLVRRRLYLGTIRDPATGAALDQAMLTVMPAPHSFTAEDVAELQCHGGPFLVRRIIALAAEAGARIAEPGEFTRRAFLNGRLDLTAAEAVTDLIHANSEGALAKALAQLSGALADRVRGLRHQLITLRAHLEVAIDFAGEDDVPAFTRGSIIAEIDRLTADLTILHDSYTRGRIIRDGARATVIGKPNAGKSSLLNLLLGAERAIVTPIPGTTRDVIEEAIRLGSRTLVLEDTAGLRTSAGEVERIGISRTRQHAANADLILAVFDSSRPFDSDDADLIALCNELDASANHPRCGLALLNKSDLPPCFDAVMLRGHGLNYPVATISALTGDGLSALRDSLESAIETLSSDPFSNNDGIVISRERHRDALARALDSLAAARAAALASMPPEIIVVDVTAASDSLGLITGEVGAEDILDAIFREFCLGK